MGTHGGERYQRAPSWAGLAEIESWEESQHARSQEGSESSGYGGLHDGRAAGELHGSTCPSPMLRMPDENDFAKADERLVADDSDEGLPDLGKLLGENAWVSKKTSWASIVERERTATRTASLTVYKPSLKLDSPSTNTVSWADSLEVYHEHDDSESGTVFRFDEENDHNQDPRILDSMLDIIGLSPLADEELSLRRGEEFADHYIKYMLLGEGMYGEVWSCIRVADNKDGFAVKFLEKRDAWVVPDAMREINILARLRECPQIVHYFECFDEPTRMAIVTEEVAGESLLYYLDEHGVLSEAAARDVVRDIALALQFSHSLGIAHRDIKPANILCCRVGAPAPCKVADFGLSHIALYTTTPALCTPVGTVQFLAPEVLDVMADAEGVSSYTKKCDIWALGVILYIMLCGSPPFLNVDCGTNCGFVSQGRPCDACADQLMANIQSNDLDLSAKEWGHISPDAIDLLQWMFRKNPEERCSATQVLGHAWVTNTHEARPAASLYPWTPDTASPTDSRTSRSLPEQLHMAHIKPLNETDRGPSPNGHHIPGPRGPGRPHTAIDAVFMPPNSPRVSQLSLSPILSPPKGAGLAVVMPQEDLLLGHTLLQRRQRRASSQVPDEGESYYH